MTPLYRGLLWSLGWLPRGIKWRLTLGRMLIFQHWMKLVGKMRWWETKWPSETLSGSGQPTCVHLTHPAMQHAWLLCSDLGNQPSHFVHLIKADKYVDTTSSILILTPKIISILHLRLNRFPRTLCIHYCRRRDLMTIGCPLCMIFTSRPRITSLHTFWKRPA